MSGTINIAGLTPVDDPAYRYKMPKIQAKVEGRGNGIKTLLVNVADLGLSLNRDPPEITKFFGCELGSQTTFSADTNRAIVNGSHTTQDLQTHISKYIENFVLCKNCRLPETFYKIKHGIISQKCNACGSNEPVDMTHKLTTFILAQHKKSKELAAKSEKKDKKKDKKDKEEDSATATNGDATIVTKEKSDKSEKSDKPKKEKKEKSNEDGSEKTKKKSSKKKSSNDSEDVNTTANVDADDESDSKATEEAIARFKNWRIENIDAPVDAILEELRLNQTLASLRPSARPIIFIGAVFTETIVTSNEIIAYANVLKALAPSQIQQRHLISAFEWFCGVLYPNLSRFFPVVLKHLFDNDIVEEDVFLKWGSDLSRNEFSADHSMISIDTLDLLKSYSAPFLNWLQEAEEESDDEEEDEAAEDVDED